MSDAEPELRALVRAVLGRHGGRDPEGLWRALREAGATEVAASRPDPGAEPDPDAGDLRDLAACAEEIGAAGASVPFIERSVARWAAGDLAGDPAAVTTATGHVRAGNGRLHGTVTAPWATPSGAAVVLADEPGPVLVRLDGDGVTLRGETNVADEPVTTVTLDGAPFVPVPGVPGPAVTARLRVLRAAALTGVSRTLYERTRRFVREREQFGRPLLKIPAVASEVAVMRTWLGQPSTALRRALSVALAVPPGGTALKADTAALAARLLAAESATHIARIAHQLHGAVGVTEEFGLHRLTRRAWAWRDADWSERELAIELGRRAVAAPETDYWEAVTA